MLRKQLAMFGKVLRLGPETQWWKAYFSRSGLQPATNEFVRRVGRLQKQWVPIVWTQAKSAAGSEQQLRHVVLVGNHGSRVSSLKRSIIILCTDLIYNTV